jgi:putative Mg2+ transporter-C (MgtC) family protein
VAPAFGEVALRLLLAVIAGGLVGFEREWRRKPAGLRTHMMVCLGAATFTLVTLQLHHELRMDGSGLTRLDPLRLVQGVVGGIGFLGAGAIIQGGGSVRGLTTAGGLWLVGALGVAIGCGALGTAGVGLGLALVVLLAFRKLEAWMHTDAGGDATANDAP